MPQKQTVAVLGASTNRAKYGNKSVRAHLRAGWDVYPVNPRADEIEGLKCYHHLRDIPTRINRVTVYLPPKLGLAMLDDIAAAKPDELFLNPGAESPELIQRARELGLEPIQACSIIDIGQRPD